VQHIICPKLEGYLRSWHNTAITRKAAAGYAVDLPYEDFLGLFQKHQLVSLQKRIESNSIRYFMAETNSMAYVLTWVSYSACSSRVFDKTTATVCARWKSAQINLPAKGDELRPEHKASIGESLRGVAKTDDHKKAISEGCKGVSKAGWSAERKAARSALRQAQEAAKRAAQ
jgi:hypothetical protein